MARPREVPGFKCEETFAAAAARVVRVRGGEVFERSRGVLDLEKIERVHDMRVATRRLRSALEMFEPCFPPKRFRRVRREVKVLADALGERRDRDVQIEQLTRLSDAVAGPDRAAIGVLVERLRVEQAQANEVLAAAVAAKRLRRLRRRLEELVEGGEGKVKKHKGTKLKPGKPLGLNARRIVRIRLAELRQLGPEALEPEASQAQHALRLAAKRLRYVLEIVGPCLGPEVRGARALARELQTVLGGIHDCDEMLPRAEGIATLEMVLRIRRTLLFRRFLELWGEGDGAALTALGRSL